MNTIYDKQVAGPKKNGPLEKWDLNDLIGLARHEGWLPALGAGEPRDLNDSKVGNAVDFLRWLRNVAIHPGRLVREDIQLRLNEIAYRNAYGIMRAMFDETYRVIQSLG